jgi:deazaflavin-dependent oxidoreductase (nitroreductase family)
MKLRDRVVLAVLRRRAHGRLSRAVMVLRVRGRRTGDWHQLPVQYAVDGDGLVVFPGHPERKRWWRNLRGGADVRVLTDGSWHDGSGRVMWADDRSYDRSRLAYSRRFPRTTIPLDAPLVRVDLDESP